jgi:MarR family transcriptional regulator, transcriptional regulator for hemolysin
MTDPTSSLGFVLHDVARLLSKRFEQLAEPLGLTRAQWRTVVYLSKNEGMNQACLADLLEIEPITAARRIDRLEQRGLIERRVDPSDRRAWRLFLKQEARPLLEAIAPLGEATRAEALEGVGGEQRDGLMETLTLMKSNLLAACQAPRVEKEARHG